MYDVGGCFIHCAPIVKPSADAGICLPGPGKDLRRYSTFHIQNANILYILTMIVLELPAEMFERINSLTIPAVFFFAFRL
jgi:hypothetical protein